MNNKNQISSLCRIKVNKMLSSLNQNNNNIFIPKYTIYNTKEEKYSFINKSKEKSTKKNHNNILKYNSNIKPSTKNRIHTETTKENYTKQPIDFIINNGVLVYQRNLKGEEIINLGINNEYIRKNNFKMDNNNINKQSLSNYKNNKLINSKKKMYFITETNSSKNKDKNKNFSFCRNKVFNTSNLNNTLNSINSRISMNINNNNNNKNSNQHKINKNYNQINLNNSKNIINYVRKRSNFNDNTFHIIKQKKNYSTLEHDENIMINNKTELGDNNNVKRKIKFSPKKKKQNISINNNLKIIKLINNLNTAKIFYLKKYFKIFKEKLSKNINDIIKDVKNTIEKIDKAINKNIIKKKYTQEHNKSNSIIVNKNLSTITTYKNEFQNNNKILNLLIAKNLRFFSKEKDTNNNKNENESEGPELYRDSKSLQKKYEQICRRRKKKKAMTSSKRFRDNSTGFENYSDTNKTNSLTNLNDNISVNSFKLKNDYIFNQFYKNNSIDKENNNEKDNNNLNEKRKNLSENKNEKNKNIIKLIKRKYKSDIKFNKNIIINGNKNFKQNSYNINNEVKCNTINNKINNKDVFKKVFIHKRKNYFQEDKNTFKIKDKLCKKNNIYNDKYNFSNNPNISLLIKNICTRDRRIFVHITYVPLIIPSSNQNKQTKYNSDLLKIQNILSFCFNLNNKKNQIKKINEFEKKLSLIKEEDEKSKYFSSTKSSIIFDEELNSIKKTKNNRRITKNLKEYNLNITKIINLLQKYHYKYYKNRKKEFIFNLKIVYLVASVKKIINHRIKDNYIFKRIKKLNEEKNDENKCDIYNNKILKEKIIESYILSNSNIETFKMANKIFYEKKSNKNDLFNGNLNNENIIST